MLQAPRVMAVTFILLIGLGLGWVLRAVTSPGHQEVDSVGTVVPDQYAFLYVDPTSYDPDEVREQIPVDSITLARGTYDPNGLNYRVVLSREGESRYELRTTDVTRPFAGRRGTYTGQVGVRDFAALALVAERLDFSAIEQRDRPPDTHSYTVMVTLVGQDGRVRRSALWEDLPELWALAEAIDGVAQKMPWRELSVEEETR